MKKYSFIIFLLLIPAIVSGQTIPRKQYENNVRELFNQNKYDTANETLAEGLRLYPESAELNRLKGILLNIAGRPESGLVYAKKSVALDSSFTDGYVSLIQNLWTLGRIEEAKTALAAADRHTSVDARIEVTRSLIHYDLTEFDEAEKAADRALKNDSTAFFAYYMKAICQYADMRIPDGMRSLIHALNLKVYQAQFYSTLASGYILINQNSEAERALKYVVKASPGRIYEQYLLALLYLKEEKVSDALNTLIEVMKKAGVSPLYFLRGVCQYKNKNFSAAAEAFRIIVNNDPLNYFAWIRLGDCYLAEKKYKAADEMYRNAVRIYPELQSGYSRLVALSRSGYAVDGLDDINSALAEGTDRFSKELKSAEQYLLGGNLMLGKLFSTWDINIKGADPLGYILLAMSNSGFERLPVSGLAACVKLMEKNADTGYACRLAGSMFYIYGDNDTAFEYFKKAVAASPADALSYYLTALIFKRQRVFNFIESNLKKALKADSGLHQARLLLAETYFDFEMPAKAAPLITELLNSCKDPYILSKAEKLKK